MIVPAIQAQLAEPTRPQYHFTARTGWLNDPNGLVFFKGKYHLFFQHNPLGTQWGNMTWGHAVSTDLLHWTELESALKPDSSGTMFSGSGVIDTRNMAGFGTGAMVLLYTAAGGTNEDSHGKPFTQGLAWSTDGTSFNKLETNPVISHIEAENRDPKVVWHEQTKTWILALYLNDDRYALFSSLDLKTWSKVSDVSMPGTGECPDFFPLALDGDRNQTYWVFSGANGNYRIGTFDGRSFKPVSTVLPSNFGPNSYAAQTFFNDPKGRRIQLSWMRGSDFNGVAWNQQMSLPRELTLRSTPLGARLFTSPARELKNLRTRKLKLVANETTVPNGLCEVMFGCDVPRTGQLTLQLGDKSLVYSADKHELVMDNTVVSCAPVGGRLSLQVFVDHGSIEVFAQNGLISMPFFAINPVSDLHVGLKLEGVWDDPTFTVYQLKPALTGLQAE